LGEQRRGFAHVGIEPWREAAVGRPQQGAAGARQAHRAQQAVGAREPVDHAQRERLAAAPVPRHDLCQRPALGRQQLAWYGAHPRLQVIVHRPFTQCVRDMRHVGHAVLVLGHEAVVGHHVREQVAGVAERHRALLVAVRGGEPAQRRPQVVAPEDPDTERAPGERKVRQAGAGQHQARKPQRRAAHCGIQQRDGAQHVLREEEVRLQSPGERVAGEQQQGNSEKEGLHGQASSFPRMTRP